MKAAFMFFGIFLFLFAAAPLPSFSLTDEISEYDSCKGTGRHHLAPPEVNIYRVKDSGSVFGGKQKIKGSVAGVCLVDAGCFEYGEKVSDIPVRTKRDFDRYEFECTVRMDRSPEVRVYNMNGYRDSVVLGGGSYVPDIHGYPRDSYDQYRRRPYPEEPKRPEPRRDDRFGGPGSEWIRERYQGRD